MHGLVMCDDHSHSASLMSLLADCHQPDRTTARQEAWTYPAAALDYLEHNIIRFWKELKNADLGRGFRLPALHGQGKSRPTTSRYKQAT